MVRGRHGDIWPSQRPLQAYRHPAFFSQCQSGHRWRYTCGKLKRLVPFGDHIKNKALPPAHKRQLGTPYTERHGDTVSVQGARGILPCQCWGKAVQRSGMVLSISDLGECAHCWIHVLLQRAGGSLCRWREGDIVAAALHWLSKSII